MPDADRNENILINHVAQTRSRLRGKKTLEESLDRIKLESHSFLLCFGHCRHRVDMSKGRKVAVMRRTKRHHVINGNRESFSSFLFFFPLENRSGNALTRPLFVFLLLEERKKFLASMNRSKRKMIGSRSPESSVATVCLSLSRGGKTGPRNAVYVDIFERIRRLFPSFSSPLELPPQVSLLLQSLSFEDEPNGSREREDYGSSGRAES